MAYSVFCQISCPATGCSCAMELTIFNAERFGTRYAAPVTSQRVNPCAMPANPRKSSAKLPITNKEKANTAESRGEENDENNSASEQIIRNSRMMKYRATSIKASARTNLGET